MLQPVVVWAALVYVSMSDEVVDRVMRQRGSMGLGWLEQPLTDGRCEKILNASVLLRGP